MDGLGGTDALLIGRTIKTTSVASHHTPPTMKAVY
jgi:hypothetical protein